MNWTARLTAGLLLSLALCACPPGARAADHRDGSAAGVLGDPSTDINDVFAWVTPDKTKVNLIMTVYPAADSGVRFSNAAWYVFHTTSKTALANATFKAVDIICGFSADATQLAVCYVGSNKADAVTGDASVPTGLVSTSGKVKLFAGPRRDPFFFNLEGFKAAADAIKGAYPGLVLDANGCPTLQLATRTALLTQLQKAPPAGGGMIPGSGTAADAFRTFNTLAIVLQIDASLMTTGGPIVTVWGATHKKQ